MRPCSGGKTIVNIVRGRWGILVGHDMPFIEKGNKSFNIKFDFRRSRGTTHRNTIMMPSLFIEFMS